MQPAEITISSTITAGESGTIRIGDDTDPELDAERLAIIKQKEDERKLERDIKMAEMTKRMKDKQLERDLKTQEKAKQRDAKYLNKG